MIGRGTLLKLYQEKKLSVSTIAKQLKCSQHQVNYWLSKFKIPKRSISDALYEMWNPAGDPFKVSFPRTINEAILYGIGIGLYWGEGTKANRGSIRLGNSDPKLISIFIQFLVKCYGIQTKKLRFGLQIFGDMNKTEAIRYWMRLLRAPRQQFLPTIVVTPHRGIGNYRRKTRYGILTVYFNNKKLRDILCNAIEGVAKGST
ncbi:MAG: hypothetical protein RLZZ416_253 [Candidatus Parcubacteria bacterium]|jgi:hypothetical protein